jgi:hypothetical protein
MGYGIPTEKRGKKNRRNKKSGNVLHVCITRRKKKSNNNYLSTWVRGEKKVKSGQQGSEYPIRRDVVRASKRGTRRGREASLMGLKRCTMTDDVIGGMSGEHDRSRAYAFVRKLSFYHPKKKNLMSLLFLLRTVDHRACCSDNVLQLTSLLEIANLLK